MQGWVSLHRKLLVSDIFHNEKLLKVFIYCLLKASHTEHSQKVGRQTVELKPGQFIFGRKKAAMELDMKESSVRDYMNILKKDETITIKATNKYSVVTIANWAFYQDKEEKSDNKDDSKKTTKGQQINTNNNGNNGDNENNNIKPSSRKRVYDKESVEYQLANRLFERIKENNPNHREPNLQNWANDVRLMMERDKPKRTEEQIRYLIDWSQQDSFWKTIILSPGKLREKFDQLVAKIKSDQDRAKGQNKQRIISMQKPEHIPDPEVPEDIDEKINEMLSDVAN